MAVARKKSDEERIAELVEELGRLVDPDVGAGDSSEESATRPPTPLSEKQVAALRGELVLRLRSAREVCRLTTRDVADLYGKTTQWVRDMEAGRQWPPHWYLVAFAARLGISVGWFYGESDGAQ